MIIFRKRNGIGPNPNSENRPLHKITFLGTRNEWGVLIHIYDELVLLRIEMIETDFDLGNEIWILEKTT